MTSSNSPAKLLFGLAALSAGRVHDVRAAATACATCPASIWYLQDVNELRAIDKAAGKVAPTGLQCYCTQVSMQSWNHNMLNISACAARNILLAS